MATVGDLSKKFGPQLDQLQAIFPDWDEQDLVFALQDSKGSVEDTVLAISEGRASQFTQATKKKPTKPAGSKVYGGRNADAGGWENAESFAGGGRGGRSGGRGGRGGGVARGMAAIRGARVGRAGARGGRGGFGNVNGGAKKTDGPSEGWPTTTATTIDGWSSQVEQAEAASAHEDDGGWGDAPASEPAKTEEPAAPVEAPKEVKEPVKRGAWGKELPKSMQSPKPPAPAPAAPAAAPAAPVAAAIAAPVAAPSPPPPAPVAAAAPAAPAPKPKMTWAQIAKPIEKPKPTPPPAPKAPEPQPEAVSGPEEPTQDEEEVVGEAEPEQFENEEPVETTPEVPEEPAAAEPEPVVAEVKPEEPAVEKPAAPAAAEESWASDPAIVGSAAPPAAAAPEPVTTYTGPPGFNTVASKAVGAQQPRTSSRGAQRFKNAGGEAVVLPAQASGVSAVEIQFGNLSFGGLNGDGVETPVQPEEPAAATSPIAHAAPIAPAAPAAAQSQASSWQQAAPQQSAGYPSQAQAQQTQAYESYGQQQQPQQQETQQTQQPQQQQAQQSQYGYRQDGYYNPIGTQAQQGQQAEQSQQQQGQQAQSQQQQQQQQPQQPSYDQYGAGGFSNQWSGQQQPPQHNDYGHGRNFDSFSNTGYPRPPVDEPKQQTPTPAAPAQPQQNVPHQQQNQYYSALGNMGYYHPHSGPYNPYYQYGQTHNPGFQQYYPMAGRQLYGQPPAHQPPAPIPANKPTPPTHSPYGVPNPYPSSGFDDQSYGLGRFGESNKASANLQSSAQSQQTPQPIGAGSLPQSGYPSQQGLHNFLGGGINTPTGSSASQQPTRPQAGTPEDSFKAQGAGQQSGGAAAGARGAQPQQPQTQQAFASYPYAGYQSHDWSPYGQQQHYGGSRNGGYSGGWQQ